MQKAAEEADLVLSDDDYSDGEKVGSPSNQIKSNQIISFELR